VVGLSS